MTMQRRLTVSLITIALLSGVLVANRYYPGIGMRARDRAGLALPPRRALAVEKIYSSHDQDADGLDDMDDILEGAKKEARNRTRYSGAYYVGGYPPEDEGACTDVVWRALKNAGYDLKNLVDEDIRRHADAYPRVGGRPDPNIDFRRVPNLEAFFRRHGTTLTSEVIPWDADNLKEWQRGDIVVFSRPVPHIAVISDRRRRDGVPFILHNCGPCAEEADSLRSWPSSIGGHFRFPGGKSSR